MDASLKKRIITIGGRPGSGKSTASKDVAAELGYEHFSSGDLFRSIGKEHGVDVHDTNLLAETNKSIDEMVDQRLRDIGATQDQVVIDSRLAWHWMPNSFKVFLNLDLDTAAERILDSLDDKRTEHEEIPEDPKQYAKRLKSRLDLEARRYKKLYNVDPYNIENYDLVIDTAANNQQAVLDKILDAYKKWLA